MAEVEMLDSGEETRTELWNRLPEIIGKDVTVSRLIVVFEEGSWTVKADRRGIVSELIKASVLEIVADEVVDGNL